MGFRDWLNWFNKEDEELVIKAPTIKTRKEVVRSDKQAKNGRRKSTTSRNPLPKSRR